MAVHTLSIFLLISTILIALSQQYQHHLTYEVDCNFKTTSFKLIGEVYMCDITNNLIVTERHIGISAMNGKHESGKSVADVKSVYVYFRTVNFIPDFTLVTTNLISITLEKCRLIRLRKQDLQPYDKLVLLDLKDNYLKHIEKDVFMYNKNLKLVQITNNKLTRIDPNVFDNLKALEILELNGNDCFSKLEKTPMIVKHWIQAIKDNCQDYPEPIVARPHEEYKRNVRQKTSIWVTFGVTFATFSIATVVIIFLYNIKRFLPF